MNEYNSAIACSAFLFDDPNDEKDISILRNCFQASYCQRRDLNRGIVVSEEFISSFW